MADNGDATAVAGEPPSTGEPPFTGGDTFDAPASPTALKPNTELTAPTVANTEQPESAPDILQPDDAASCETLETTLNTPVTPLADSEMSEAILQGGSEAQQTEDFDTTEQLEQPAVHSDTTEVPLAVVTSEAPESSEPTPEIVPFVSEPAKLNHNETTTTVLETEDNIEMAVAEVMTENTVTKSDEETKYTFQSIPSELPTIVPVGIKISLDEADSFELPQTDAILAETPLEKVKKAELSQSEIILDVSALSELPPSDPTPSKLPSTDVIPSEVTPAEPLSSRLHPTEPMASETTLTETILVMQPSIEITTTVKSELIDELAEPEDLEMAEPLMASEPKTETPDLETGVEPPLDIDEPMMTDVPAEDVTSDQVESVQEVEKLACVRRTEEAAGAGEEEEERTVTMLDVLQEQEALEDSAGAVLGGSDDNNCTYAEGYIKRQALYACMTCCSDAKEDPSKRAGVCLACSLTCHENHELIELYTKRDFRCDCGNPNFNSHRCNFTKEKNDLNDNKYNQNFSGLYCICHRPYPDPESSVDDEMIQCIVCEDWLHTSHLDATVPANDQYSEMICKLCMEKNAFLHDYTCYAVAVEEKDLDEVSSVDKINESGKESPIKTRESEKILHSDSIQVEGQCKDSSDPALADNGNDTNEQLINVLSENSLKESTDEGNVESLPDSTKEVTSNVACEPKVTTDISTDASQKELLKEQNNETSNGTSGKTNENSVPMEEKNEDDINVKETVIDPHKTDLPIEKAVNTSEACTENILQEEISETDATLEDDSSPINIHENDAPKERLQQNHEVTSKLVEEVESNNEINVNIPAVKNALESCKTDISDEKSIPADSTQEDQSRDISEEKNLTNETIESLTEASTTSNELKLSEITADNNTNIVKEDDCDVDTKIDENKDSILQVVASQDDVAKLTDVSADNKKDDVDMNISEDKESIHQVLPIQNDNKITEDSLISNVEPSSTEIQMNQDETSVHLPMELEPKANLDIDTSETKDPISDAKLTAEVVDVAIDVEMKDDSASINGDGSLPKDTVESSSNVITECSQNTDIQTTAGNDKIETGDKVSSDIKLNGDIHQANIDVETTNKRKLSTDITEEVDQISVKKAKLDNGIAENCQRPKPEVKKVIKGATFWPCSWRQKLCSCHNCVSMYRDNSVLFLLDLQDTVNAYEELGKAKNGGKLSQYEKGLEALSSLDRIHQINALTEYNKMKDNLLDFLISFKNRQEVVKVEDIEKFFADIKPKRQSDGVYFCR